MLRSEKRDEGYTLKCLHELYFEAHVLYPDMHKLRLRVSAAMENLHHLDLGVPADDPGGNVAPELAAAVAVQLPVTHGLATFQLKLPGLTGDALFPHMVAFRARHSAKERPSTFLEVEMTEEQGAILAPTIQDLSVQSILKGAGGGGATKKLAQRKLNNAGAITNHCGLENHPGRVKKLLAAAQLAASLAEISALTKATKEQGKCKADTELMDLAPASLVKLNSEKVNGDLTKLSKEICAISFCFFVCMYKEANPKQRGVSCENAARRCKPTFLPIFCIF
jgi:hypothetical protein